MSVTPIPTPAKIVIPSLTPKQILLAIAFAVTQAVAFGILTPGVGQTIVAIGGIVIPAAFSIASALHLGLVHAAIVKAAPPGTTVTLKS